MRSFNTRLSVVLLLGAGLGACSDRSSSPLGALDPGGPARALSPVTATQTSTGYYYPLGTTSFYTGCPSNGGTWLGTDAVHGGCYTSGFYHIGFDMFNSATGMNSPVFAMATGTVIYIDPNSSWTYNSGISDNTAVFVTSTTASGASYVALYGHLLRSSIKVQVGDVVTAGTLVGLIGYWSPPHVHLGIWPNRSTLPPSPWGRDGMQNYPNAYGTTSPTTWITSSSSAPKCQNGGTVYYSPNGATPRHPNGTLFSVKGDGTVYVLYNNETRGIPSPSILYELYGPGRGFDFRDVIQISQAEFNTYAHGAPVNSALPWNGRNQPDGRLIQQWGTAEVSIVTDNGMRRPFASLEAFLNLGYQFCNVAGVSDYASYPVGPIITQ